MSAKNEGDYFEKVWCQDEALRGHNNAGYRGCQTRTVSGKKCLNWKDAKYERYLPFGALPEGQNNNYCRNPDPEKMDDIWCYTSLDGENGQVEKCVPQSDRPVVDNNPQNFDDKAKFVSLNQSEVFSCNERANAAGE